jgi:hypothetical protein
MSDLEKELGLALRREEPPEGFAERVLARIAEEPPAIPRSRRRPRVLYGMAATAAAAAIAGVFALGAWRVASPLPGTDTAGPQQVADTAPAPDIEPVPPTKEPRVVPPPLSRRAPTKTKRPGATHRRSTPRKEETTLAEARHAQEQLMLALRIASDSLGTARRMTLDEPREPGT